MMNSNAFAGILIQGKCSDDRIDSIKRFLSTTTLIILSAILINGLLLMGLALINKTPPETPNIKPIESMMLYKYTPPEPTQIKTPERETELPPRSTSPSIQRPIAKPILNPPVTSVMGSSIGTVPVPVIRSHDVKLTDAPRDVLEIDQVDTHPQLIYHYTPMYPFSAKRKGIEGQVTVRFIVDANGKVVNPFIIDAVPKGIFEEPALKAVAKWRFKPAILNKKPVDVYVTVPLVFELH